MLADIDWSTVKEQLAAMKDEEDEQNPASQKLETITHLFSQSDPFTKFAINEQSQFSMVSTCTSRLNVFYRRNPGPKDLLYKNRIPLGLPLTDYDVEACSFTCLLCKRKISSMDHRDHENLHHVVRDDVMHFITVIDLGLEDNALFTKAVAVEATFKLKLVSGDSPDKVYKMRPRPRDSWKSWRVVRGFAASEEDIE